MGFGIFILIVSLLLPLSMIGLGAFFVKEGIKEPNWAFGYRTSLSMKNKDTWQFAHIHCGKLWRVIGLIMLLLSIIAMIFLIGQGEEVVGIYGLIVMIVQMVVLIISIFPTQIALMKTFDKDGNRKT